MNSLLKRCEFMLKIKMGFTRSAGDRIMRAREASASEPAQSHVQLSTAFHGINRHKPCCSVTYLLIELVPDYDVMVANNVRSSHYQNFAIQYGLPSPIQACQDETILESQKPQN